MATSTDTKRPLTSDELTEEINSYQSGQVINPVNFEDEPEKEEVTIDDPEYVIANMVNRNYNNRNEFLEMASSGYGSSHLDKKFDYQSDRDLEDMRADQQKWISKVENGILKAGTTALATWANGTVGLVSGLLSSGLEYHKQFWKDGTTNVGDVLSAGVNNKVSKFLVDFQTKMDEVIPNYRTEEERTEEYQKQWIKHMGSGNFIGDSLIKNFGFTIGAMGAGMTWNSLLGKLYASDLSRDLMKGATQAAAEGDVATASKLKSAAERIRLSKAINEVDMDVVVNNIKDAGKAIKNAQLSTQLFGAVTSAMGEGSMEGLMARDEFLKEYTPVMNQQYLEAYDSMAERLAADNPNDFGVQAVQDENGNIAAKFIPITPDGVDKMKAEEMRLSDNYRKAQEYAEKQADVLTNTVFMLNLPVLMGSNLLQFGRMFGGGWTTARRNIPKVNGSLESGYSGINNPILKGILGSAKVGASEAAEEMSQGFISSGAKNTAGTRLTYFNDLGYDEEATNKAIDGISFMISGGRDYLGDSANWQEGFIGALTGLFGIPGFQFRQYHSVKDAVKDWNGGIIGEINQTKAQVEASAKAAQVLNDLVGSKDFNERWRGYIRHQKFDDQMAQAVSMDDEKAWHDNDMAQLASDVIDFAEAGRIDDLYQFVDKMSSVNPNDETAMNDIKEFMQPATPEEQKAFKNNTNEYILGKIQTQAKNMKDMIDSYREAYTDLANVMPGDINSKRFNEMLFTYMYARSLESRFGSMVEETLNAMDDLFGRSAGQNETDKNKINQNIEELREEFRNALSGNTGSSLRDKLFEARNAIRLEEAQKALEASAEKLTGKSQEKAANAAKMLRDMRAIAQDRRDALRKIENLRNITNEEFDDKAQDSSKLVKVKTKKSFSEDIASFKDVDDVVDAINSRTDSKEREDYIASLLVARDSNPVIDEYFKITEIKPRYNQLVGSVATDEDTDLVKNTANEIVDLVIGNGMKSDDILGLRKDLIPTFDNMVNSLIKKLGESGDAAQATGIAARAVYDRALDLVRRTFAKIQDNDTATNVAKAAGNEAKAKGDPVAKAYDKPVGDPRKSPAQAEAEAEQRAMEAAAKEVAENLRREAEAEAKKKKPIASTDAPNEGSASQVTEPVPGSDNEVMKGTLNDGDPGGLPDIKEPSPIAINAGIANTDLSRDNKKAIVADAASGDRDVSELIYLSKSSGKVWHFYNTAIPEVSLDDMKDIRTALASRDITGANKVLRDFVEFDNNGKPVTNESYAELYKYLVRNGAFINADEVKLGDNIYFVIDPNAPLYNGQPHIFMAYNNEIEPGLKIVNVLRAKSGSVTFSGLDALRDRIMNEYNEFISHPENEGKVFTFSKTSEVWARQSGYIHYNKGSYAEVNKPVNNISGYNPYLPVIAIGRDGKPVMLNGDTCKLTSTFTESINKRFGKDSTQIVGNLYYLAQGKDNYGLPIRLSVEHFNDSTANRTGYGFDQINECINDLADVANKFGNGDVDLDTAKNLKSEIIGNMSTMLDLHGLIFTFGYTNGKYPTLRISAGEGKVNEKGEYSVTSYDVQHDLVASEVTVDKIKDILTGLNRSFNIELSDSSENKEHFAKLVKNGLILTNADSLRPKGTDIYINSWNEEKGDFEKLEDIEKLEDTEEKKSQMSTAQPDPIPEKTEAELEQDSAAAVQPTPTPDSKPASGNITSGKYVLSELSENVRNSILERDITEEEFNNMDKDTQEIIIRC